MHREELQPVWRHLVQRPKNERAQGQDEVRPHLLSLTRMWMSDRQINERSRDGTAGCFEHDARRTGVLQHEPNDKRNAK